MISIKTMYRISKLFITKKYIDINDIANSYTRVSESYDKSFLYEMKNVNKEMLDELILSVKDKRKDKNNKVLDLACGTGFNSEYINSKINCSSFTLVDISEGMLKQAKKKLNIHAELIEADMLSFLKNCKDNSFDVVICAWAIKYQNPHKIIKEVSRVLNKNGVFAVVVNLKNTLPEIRSIYPKIINEHNSSINKLMLELPNPINSKSFTKWFEKEKLSVEKINVGSHMFAFDNSKELVSWITSTGALAGFDSMIDLSDINVLNTMIKLVEKNNIKTVTHKYVWGVFRNEK